MIGGPVAAGLCKKLVEVITTEPGRFASEAPAFADLPDDYLRAVFTGLREATKQGVVTFDWAPVLDLVRLVAGRSTGDTEADRWLRISVARLLAAGFANGAGEIPASARSQVWEIIRPIAISGSHRSARAASTR